MRSPKEISPSRRLLDQFGQIDIYLFDQIQRGRFDDVRTVLDAGCGGGRNLVWLLREGFEVFGIDRDERAIERVRELAGSLAPRLPGDHFVVGDVGDLPWATASMDAVISSAVLHFARHETHFGEMVREMWRVLRPGGLFFARLASVIGLEVEVRLDENRRVRLPDGSERFVVDEALLLRWTGELGGELLDPIKTTNVQNLRCMTTWVLRKAR